MKNKKCIKCFEWTAICTLDPSVDSSFTNEYDLLTLYQNRWNFGITEDGDITKVENLKSYKYSCKKIKLMTADGGIKNLSNNISLNKLKLSEIAFMFYNLPKNGNFVIRLYIPVDKALMIDLIYLINKKFKTVYFYKPLENIYSGEFYLIALNYQGLEEKYMNKILRLLNKYNNETMDKLITKGNYDNSFKNQIFNKS